jgi:hypothetical protein
VVVKRIKRVDMPDTLIIPHADSEAYKVEFVKEGKFDTEKLSYLLTENMRNSITSITFGAQVRDSNGNEVGLVLETGRDPEIPKDDAVLVVETENPIALLKVFCRLTQTQTDKRIKLLKQKYSKNVTSQHKRTS